MDDFFRVPPFQEMPHIIYIYIYYIIYIIYIYMYMYTFDHSTISWAPTNGSFSVSVGEFHVFFFAVYGGDIEETR